MVAEQKGGARAMSEPTNGTLAAQLGVLGQDVAVLKRENASLASGLAQLSTKLDADVGRLVTKIDADVGRLVTKIDALGETLTSAAKTNWPLLASAAVILFGVIGGGWAMINMSTQLTVSQALLPIVAQNASSSQDRDDMHKAIATNREATGELARDLASLEASLKQQLTEVETQFTAQDTAHNLARVDELRTRALIWRKVFGEHYPELFYAPSVGRNLRDR
jgi:hypothetical protein